MRSPESILLDLATSHHMVVSRRLILEAGLTDVDLKRFLRHDLLDRTVTPGVYGVGGPPRGSSGRMMAAVESTTGAAVYRRSAATVLALPMSAALRVDTPEIVVPHGTTSSSAFANVHRTRHLPPVDVTCMGPLPVTTASRTFCDLATVAGSNRLKTLGEELIAKNFASLDDLLGCASAFVRRGRPGSTRLREVMSQLDRGDPIPRSVLEADFVRAVVVPFRLPLSAQLQPPWYDGWRGLADFGNRQAQLIVEVDGRKWHQITQDLERDRVRDRLAYRHGYLPLRFTASEIRRDPATVAAEIGHHLVERAA